MWCSAWSCF